MSSSAVSHKQFWSTYHPWRTNPIVQYSIVKKRKQNTISTSIHRMSRSMQRVREAALAHEHEAHYGKCRFPVWGECQVEGRNKHIHPSIRASIHAAMESSVRAVHSTVLSCCVGFYLDRCREKEDVQWFSSWVSCLGALPAPPPSTQQPNFANVASQLWRAHCDFEFFVRLSLLFSFSHLLSIPPAFDMAFRTITRTAARLPTVRTGTSFYLFWRVSLYQPHSLSCLACLRPFSTSPQWKQETPLPTQQQQPAQGQTDLASLESMSMCDITDKQSDMKF